MSRPLEGCWNRPVLILCSSLQSFTIAPSPHSVLILAYGLFVPWTTVGPNLHPEIIRRVPPLLIQWQCQSQAWIKSEVDANGHTLTLNWNWNAWLSDSEVSIFYVISKLFFLPTNPSLRHDLSLEKPKENLQLVVYRSIFTTLPYHFSTPGKSHDVE